MAVALWKLVCIHSLSICITWTSCTRDHHRVLCFQRGSWREKYIFSIPRCRFGCRVLCYFLYACAQGLLPGNLLCSTATSRIGTGLQNSVWPIKACTKPRQNLFDAVGFFVEVVNITNIIEFRLWLKIHTSSKSFLCKSLTLSRRLNNPHLNQVKTIIDKQTVYSSIKSMYVWHNRVFVEDALFDKVLVCFWLEIRTFKKFFLWSWGFHDDYTRGIHLSSTN